MGGQCRQWCNWLHEKNKMKDEKKRRTEEHQKVGDPMRSSVQGRPGFLQRITKPAAWRRGFLQVLKELEEDAEPMLRCEEKRIRVGEALAMRLRGARRGGHAVE